MNKVLSTCRSTIRYLTQSEATMVDVKLMGDEYGFSVDQLMELAGLSCSQACYVSYPLETHPRPLLVVGPGNNGGDALVCARHLYHYGYNCTIWQPKPPRNELYVNLNKQCKLLDIPITTGEEFGDALDAEKFDFIVDGIFGFSFKGSPRAPFDKVLKLINDADIPVLSIDIPSGWDVEKGNESKIGIEPEVLISLTAPKLCAKNYTGKHFLGGRFVPPGLSKEYDLNLPKYPAMSQIVEI